MDFWARFGAKPLGHNRGLVFSDYSYTEMVLELEPVKRGIEFKDVSFAYDDGAGKSVLKNVTFGARFLHLCRHKIVTAIASDGAIWIPKMTDRAGFHEDRLYQLRRF